MVSAICAEIELRRDYIDSKITSIYFGGGTPSLLNFYELEQIFETLKKYFSWDHSAEITLEANPDDISEDNLKVWKEIGINRLSIGIQSFKESDLLLMNRAHNVNEALTAVEKARKAGISKISIDLIYGLPKLSIKDWEKHIKQAIALEVDHISAYCLTVEAGTLLHHQVKKGTVKPAGEDQQSEQFLVLVDLLGQNGFEQYEISNFASNQSYAIHNSSYWLGKPYLGVGPSAHSFNGFERRWNVSNNTAYMKSVGKNENWYEQEVLTAKDRWNELILTGLRTKFGVNLNHLETISSISQKQLEQINEFVQAGLIDQSESTIKLTNKGKLQADYIASELFI